MASNQLSPAVWTGGFALMAMTMVAARTLGLSARFAAQPAIRSYSQRPAADADDLQWADQQRP